MIACQTTTTTSTYNGFDLFNQIDRYQDVFTRREGTYVVYVYSDTCSSCQNIKQEMFEFGSDYDQKAVYYFNVSKATDAQTYQQVFLQYMALSQVQTPAIIIVMNNTFDSTNMSLYYYVGIQSVRNIVRDLRYNAYAPFQK